MIRDPDLLDHFEPRLCTDAEDCHEMAAGPAAAATVPAMAAAVAMTPRLEKLEVRYDSDWFNSERLRCHQCCSGEKQGPSQNRQKSIAKQADTVGLQRSGTAFSGSRSRSSRRRTTRKQTRRASFSGRCVNESEYTTVRSIILRCKTSMFTNR